jgi:hypothetical protein
VERPKHLQKPSCSPFPRSHLIRTGLPSPRRLRAESFLRIAAFVSIWVLGMAADAGAQAPDQVRLSLFEASARAESRSCTLEVVVNKTAGEAILSCERNTSPVSRLGAHRALTTSEAARLYALASVPASTRPQGSGSHAPASADGARVTLTINQGNQRVVLDVGQEPNTLSRNDQQTLRILRELADELRGAGRC